MADWVTRRMTAADGPVVCRHREAMFLEAHKPEDAVAAMAAPFREWLDVRLRDGRYLGWAVEREGVVIAGLGMMVLDWPPHPLHPQDARRGYILNVYVDAAWRGKGIAKGLMEAASEEARKLGIGYLVLHASALGKPLYDRLGWEGTNEMALKLA